MPIKSCWSNNSGSICHPSRRHASCPPQPPPRTNQPTPRNPAPCSGDLSNSPIDSACFFPPVEKVGLARRRAFRLIPAERLRVEDYVGDSGDPDSIVVRQAALIEG